MNSCWIHGKTMSHYIYSTNSCEQCQAKMFLVRWRTTRRLYQTWISLHDPCFPYYYRFSTMDRLNFTAWNAIYQQLSNGIKLSRFHQVQSQHTHTHIVRVDHFDWTIGMIVSEFVGRLPFSDRRWTNWTAPSADANERVKKSLASGTHVRSINGFSCYNPMDTLYFTITLNFHVIARWGLNILSACRSEKYAENVKDLQAKTTNCSFDFTTNRTNWVPGSAFTLRHPFVSTVWRFFSLFAINR